MREFEQVKPQEIPLEKQSQKKTVFSNQKQIKALQNKLSKIESSISDLEKKIAFSEKELAENSEKLLNDQTFFKTYQSYKDSLAKALEEWEHIQMQLE